MRANLLAMQPAPAVVLTRPAHETSPVPAVAPGNIILSVSHNVTNAPPPVNPPPVAQPPDELDGFTFGGPLAEPAKKKKGTAYPNVPDPDGSLGQMAAQYRTDKEVFGAVDESLERTRKEIISITRPSYYDIFAGRADAESSIRIDTGDGGVLVTFPEKWSLPNSAAEIKAIIGADLAKQLFRPAFELKVKSDALPEGPQTQQLLNEVFAVFAKYGAGNAVEFKKTIKPRKGFNSIRHSRLTKEQNLMLETVCPIQASVKTTNVQ